MTIYFEDLGRGFLVKGFWKPKSVSKKNFKFWCCHGIWFL